MSQPNMPAYGHWGIVAVNASVFVLFALSFFKPKTSRDWRTFGGFSAFIVALFAEMYGFPLTIYLLSGWLQRQLPSVNWFSHDAGHLLEMLFGWRHNPHFGPFHIASFTLIILGFTLIARGWEVLYKAQQKQELATTGVYARLRHPQYMGFILVMTGFLFQWPTLLTLLMYPILITMYVRLAHQEEREVTREFGIRYLRYKGEVPAWFPRKCG
ncbi:isoprenylcysteine carboxylmethyltransferase family protein [Synechococcus sp. A10-1-5-1]|uniref:methyltransferase family protein n=1 Tax=Synechococcus sp. A10-1-5-1 TaxID=2936507 RepID=UPI00200098CC|nr:isoprenylcysteine carboxylmethyltransferase family protein [Synechococcus sp. A10-1-5-1]UPM50788.1 isoprenylcysteine carboxylmethyltransferase family protein [Synechococcus sp. A10-1-5-1]